MHLRMVHLKARQGRHLFISLRPSVKGWLLSCKLPLGLHGSEEQVGSGRNRTIHPGIRDDPGRKQETYRATKFTPAQIWKSQQWVPDNKPRHIQGSGINP